MHEIPVGFFKHGHALEGVERHRRLDHPCLKLLYALRSGSRSRVSQNGGRDPRDTQAYNGILWVPLKGFGE